MYSMPIETHPEMQLLHPHYVLGGTIRKPTNDRNHLSNLFQLFSYQTQEQILCGKHKDVFHLLYPYLRLIFLILTCRDRLKGIVFDLLDQMKELNDQRFQTYPF